MIASGGIGILGSAPARAHFESCGGGWLRYETRTIPQQYSGSLQGSFLTATKNAVEAWHSSSDVNMSRGSNEVYWTKGALGSSGPVAETQTGRRDCRILWADVTFNSSHMSVYPQDKIQAVAAHEAGHFIGFRDIGGTAHCNPASVMLHRVQRIFNGQCTFKVPTRHDIRDVDSVY